MTGKQFSQSLNNLPINIVGSTTFGRYPKISVEQTYNMFISDDWLVPYAGYRKRATIDNLGYGRDIFNSTKSNKLIMVIDNGVYVADEALEVSHAGTIDSFEGDVFMAENNANQVAICDKKNIYIYNTSTGILQKANTPFVPIYVDFQDTYFIAPAQGTNEWYLSGNNDGFTWSALQLGTLQTKPDNVIAAKRFPGRGSQLFVMGETVTEPWVDVGYQLFPYQRTSSYNIDYGLLSAATLAAGDTFIVWLGVNEKSGPVIMYSSGGDVEQISNDGINYKLAQLKHPEQSYAFLFKQDGHLFYQITFSASEDNFSLAYDFNTKKFFTLCDENMNAHIAKRIAYFNNSYYFVSFIDGNLYEMNSIYTDYDGKEIPRIRIPMSLRLSDGSQFVGNNIQFVTEQGQGVNNNYQLPQVHKGSISTSAGFPVAGTPKIGDSYTILNPVEDTAVGRTYTNQAFDPGLIVWNGFNWDVVNSNTMRVDLSVSRDGGVSFGNSVGMPMNRLAQRQNKFMYWGLGFANEITLQFRFWGMSRFVVYNGYMSIFQ